MVEEQVGCNHCLLVSSFRPLQGAFNEEVPHVDDSLKLTKSLRVKWKTKKWKDKAIRGWFQVEILIKKRENENEKEEKINRRKLSKKYFLISQNWRPWIYSLKGALVKIMLTDVNPTNPLNT